MECPTHKSFKISGRPTPMMDNLDGRFLFLYAKKTNESTILEYPTNESIINLEGGFLF